MMARGIGAYRQAQVQTATPGQLVIQLYEGALTFLDRGIRALENRDLEGAHQMLVRVQAIVAELRGTLNHDTGAIATTLDRTYLMLYDRLVQANVHKDPEPAREVAAALRELLAAWRVVINGSEPVRSPTLSIPSGVPG